MGHETEAATSPRLSRRLASVVWMTGLGSVATMAVSTLASVAVARNGGPAGYATFITANMLIFVTAVLSSCGLPVALAKYVAREEERGHHEALRQSCTTTFILMLLSALVAGVVVSLNLSRLEQYLNVSIGDGFALAFPIILLCAATSDCVQGIYSGLLRPRSMIAITVAGPLAMIFYILVRRGGAPLPLWGAVAASYICSGVVAGYKSWRDKLLGAPALISEIRPILKDIAPAATFTFFTIFSTWSDRWIVGTQLGAIAMGSYTAAVLVIQAVLRVPTHIGYLLVPASTRMALGGVERIRKFNNIMIGIFGIFSALMMVVIMLAPTTIVRLLFGPGFSLAAPTLLIMALGLMASAVSIPFISALTGSTKNRLVIWLLALTLLPRILLLLFFTRRWSLLGTALATVLADYLLALCCLLLAHKIGIGFPLFPLLRSYLIGALILIAGLGALLLNVPQLVVVALAIAAFTPALWQAARSIYESSD